MEDNGNGSGSSAQRGIVNELVQGRDIAKKLQSILLKEPSSSSNGTRELMMQKILSSFERSIGIIQSDSSYHQQPQRTVIVTADSPNSFSGSPRSQDSDGDSKDLNLRDESRKRRLIVDERKRVRGCSSTGLEGPVDDGYSWRKYGQKDILGANYPRAYYRCTLRQVQGCLATKQVQRCDDDPTFFEVTYRGKHTCTQASSPSLLNPTDYIKPEPIETLDHHHSHPQQHSHEIIWSFRTDQNGIKPNITNNNKLLNSPSFSFASSSNPNANPQNAPTPIPYRNNNSTNNGVFSTNTNTYQQFSSPSDVMANNFNDQLGIHRRGDSVGEIGTAGSTSTTSSPSMPPEFLFDQGEFDHHNYMFGSPEFFP